jgi:hypothetical protein
MGRLQDRREREGEDKHDASTSAGSHMTSYVVQSLWDFSLPLFKTKGFATFFLGPFQLSVAVEIQKADTSQEVPLLLRTLS